MINTYYYNQQFRKFIVGFANVFTGLRVRTGQNAAGEIDEIVVPIRYGSTDRVVEAIGASNTQNKQHTLPMMSCYLTGVDLSPDRFHGVNMVDTRTVLPQGGVFPDDVKAVRRVMAIPYNMLIELAIHASNTDQLYQILEQILMLFDYDMQLQFNDAAFDWAKITKLTLLSISNEENYPSGPERRALVWTLAFELPVWLSPPADIRKEIVSSVSIRIGSDTAPTFNELDEDGNLVPFIPDAVTRIDVAPATPSTPVDPRPPGVATSSPEHYDASLDDCRC